MLLPISHLLVKRVRPAKKVRREKCSKDVAFFLTERWMEQPQALNDGPWREMRWLAVALKFELIESKSDDPAEIWTCPITQKHRQRLLRSPDG